MGEGLIMIATYNQVDNSLGIYLRYSQIMWSLPMSTGMELKPWTSRIRGKDQRGGEEFTDYW